MKKFHSFVGILAVLMGAGSVFGAGGTFLNLWTDGNVIVPKGGMGPNPMWGFSGGEEVSINGGYNLYLTQGDTPCKAGDFNMVGGFTCYKSSAELLNGNAISQTLTEYFNDWKENYSGMPMTLSSDLDLKGFDPGSDEEGCLANFAPLDMPERNAFWGGASNGFKVRNLCIEANVTDKETMSSPVGFVKNVRLSLIEDFAFKNARVVVKDNRIKRDASKAGADYYPAGVLAGTVFQSTVSKITLEDVSVEAPFAGAVAGYIKESTVKNIHATDDVFVRNSLNIAPGAGNFAGAKLPDMGAVSEYMVWPSEYTVFLGGITGMAVKDSIYDNNIRAKIFDESGAETPSALGGLAGVFAFSDLSYLVSRDTLDMSETKKSYTEISGGKAMGGFFGEVGPISGAYAVSSIVIENSKVDSVEIKSAKGQDLFVGGLVGRVVSAEGSRVKFVNNVVNVNIADSLTTAGNYHYYAGGVFGMGSPCSMDNVNSNNDTAFVSVVGSSVMGNLRVAANAVEVPDLMVKALLGGFAGSACFTANGDALTRDSSMVTVESAVKVGSDSVFVGGFVGSADIYREYELKFKNLHFGGSVAATVGSDNVKVGGIIGAFMNAQNGGRSVSFSSITLENSSAPLLKLQSDKFSAVGGKAYLGGLCGLCVSLDSASFVSVKGDIDVDDASFGGDSLIVGDLFGSIYDNASEKIANTFSVGAINVKAGTLGKAGVKVGYVAGRALLQGDVVREIVSNYHFSAKDVDYVDAFGYLSNGSEITANWKNPVGQSFSNDGTWILGYNIRNGASENLSAEADSVIGNGTMLAANMQKEDFAKSLNILQNPYVWTFEKGMNGDLPFFADDVHPAIAPPEVITHTVTFVYFKWDNEVQNFVKTSLRRDVPDGAAAVAPEVEERTGYTFDGWNVPFDNVVANMTVTALYSINSYEVIYKNGDVELQKSNVVFNTLPKYTGENPVKASTAQFSYKFAGWSPTVVPVHGPAVYMAQFDSTVNKYKISFVDGEKNIQDKVLEYGTTPICDFKPSRESTAQYTFAFKGWSPDIAPVAGSVVYQAVFDTTVNQYPVAFVSEGHELLKADFAYGSTPAYENVPVKEPTAKYTYAFKGWTPELVPVTGSAEYVAVFDSTLNQYNVVFNNEGVEVGQVLVAYGAVPSYTGIVPTKNPTAKYSYEFVGWTPALAAVTGNALYEAKFDSTLNKFAVTFKNGEEELQKQNLVYGSVPKFEGKEPVKNATAQYSYKFMGWSPAIDSVKSPAVYTAVFDSVANTFSVVFLSHEGEILAEQVVAYGDSAVAPKVNVGENQKFVRWSKDFAKVTTNLIVLAIVQDIPVSSSSVAESSSSVISSSSEPVSSSVKPVSSSSEKQSSSSSPKSSSSVESSGSKNTDLSSSSVPAGNPIEITKAEIELSGNAIRLGYGTSVANLDQKTSVRIEVANDEGVFLDTLLFDSLASKIVKGEWMLAPAPIGKYDVTLTVANASDTVVETTSFDVAGEILVQPRSWQMISLAALDKESLKASDDAAYYWWDESNPIGDYWQYRSYDSRKKYESTRGFWYGTSSGAPLVLKAETPTKDSKIVWELDSLYSGWNLVANPHGWYVDLTRGKGGNVKFWRWNAETCEYEIPSTLGPYEAVWAQVSKPTTWEVSSQPVFDIKPVDAKPLAKAGVKSGWSLRAVLSDDFGKKDSWNFLGMGDASENIEEPPAGMGDHVTLSIVEGRSYLAKSLKAESDEYSWNLVASATGDRDAKLSFEGVEALASEGLSLYVTVNGRTQAVRGDEPVALSLGTEPTQVQVRVGKGALVVSNAKLSGFNAVGANGNLQVNFDAAKNLSGARAVIQLVALDGKIVSTQSFAASYGTNRTTLRAPEHGVYFVRLKVGSQSLGGKVVIK